MKTVIMAGGKGSRIASVENNVPKPMIKIGGKPVLEYEIEILRSQGYTDIIITVCHMADIIMDYFGDGSKISPCTGNSFGVTIQYYIEKEPIGNAGALFKLRDQLEGDFLLLNADAIFNIDFNRMVCAHSESGADVTIFVHPNNHPYDSGLIMTDDNGYVTEWLTKEDERPLFYKNMVNAGIHIISSRILDLLFFELKDKQKIDLDRDILRRIVGKRKIFAYMSPEYVKDMGTPDRLEQVIKDFRNGNIEAKSLIRRQKAIFIDRDGTINKLNGFISSVDQFDLIDGIAEAISRINQSGYLAIVITNQPVIARGECSFEGLNEIHKKMETLLGQSGAYLDDIFVCPHHPDKGFEGEVKELKIDCECRKPKPGLIIAAAEKYNIDLSQSYMVGDSENDIQAAQNAGCKSVYIGKNRDYKQADYNYESVKEFVDELL